MKIYQISNEYQRILEQDEYTAVDLGFLDRLQDSLEDKAIAIANHIKNMESEMAMVHEAEKAMMDRRKRLEMKIDSLSEFLKGTLQNCKIEKITKSPHFVIRIRNNPPSVQITDEGMIPIDYYKQEVKITLDKTLVRKALDGGTIVPGASIIQKTRLEIK